MNVSKGMFKKGFQYNIKLKSGFNFFFLSTYHLSIGRCFVAACRHHCRASICNGPQSFHCCPGDDTLRITIPLGLFAPQTNSSSSRDGSF